AVRAYRVIGFDRSADVLVERGCAAGGWSSVLDVAGVVARGRLSAGQAGQVVQHHVVEAVVLTREVRVRITATQRMVGAGGGRPFVRWIVARAAAAEVVGPLAGSAADQA